MAPDNAIIPRRVEIRRFRSLKIPAPSLDTILRADLNDKSRHYLYADVPNVAAAMTTVRVRATERLDYINGKK